MVGHSGIGTGELEFNFTIESHEKLSATSHYIGLAGKKSRLEMTRSSRKQPLKSDASTKAPQTREGGDRHGRLSLLCLRHSTLGGLANGAKPPLDLVDTSAHYGERRC